MVFEIKELKATAAALKTQRKVSERLKEQVLDCFISHESVGVKKLNVLVRDDTRLDPENTRSVSGVSLVLSAVHSDIRLG